MEGAGIVAWTTVWVVTVVKPDGTNREFITQSQSNRVTHVVKACRGARKRILRTGQEIAGVKKCRALQFPIDWESIFHIKDGEKFAANRISIVVWSKVSLAEAANRGVSTIKK